MWDGMRDTPNTKTTSQKGVLSVFGMEGGSEMCYTPKLGPLGQVLVLKVEGAG